MNGLQLSESQILPERKACASCGKEFSGGEVTCSEDGTTLTPISKEGLSGVVADKYEIVCALGGGGWGTVYKARHILLKRMIAIKTLHPHMVASGTALKRFRQEALAGSQLDHSHILNVLDFGITEAGVPYIVMDFLEGQSLADTLQAGGFMEPRRAMQIFTQVASALAHAHRNGVVHRDLKPGNIMLIEHDGKPDYVKIVDFGIAKILHKDEDDDTSQLTETGQLFGSPLYMSPEQCTGKNLDGRSDIYSLGCVMYRTLTGLPPFQVKDLPDCIYKHVNIMPQRFDFVCPDRMIPPEVEQVVFKALEKDIDTRFQSMTELESAINNWLEGRPIGIEEDPGATARMTPEQMEAAKAGAVALQVVASASGAPGTATGQQPGAKPVAGENGDQAAAAPLTKTEALQNWLETGSTDDKQKSLDPHDISHHSSFLVLALVATVVVVLVPIGYFMSSHTHKHPADSSVAPIPVVSVNSSGGTNGLLESTVGTAKGGTPAPGSTDPLLKAGIDAFDNGHYKEALHNFSIAAQGSGANKPNVDALLWQGQALLAVCKYSEAKDVLRRFMDQSDAKGVNAVRGLNALAISCYWLRQFDQAQGFLDRAEDIGKKLTGPDRIAYAQTLRCLGMQSIIQKDYKTAKQRLQDALSLDSELGGPVLEKAKCDDALGDAHMALKEYSDANSCYNEALNIRKNILSSSSPEIAISLTKLGAVDYAQKNYHDAMKQFLGALSINQQNFPEKNADTAVIYGWLAAVSGEEKGIDHAIEYQRKVVETQKALYGDNSAEALAAMKSCEALERKKSGKGPAPSQAQRRARRR